MNTATSNAVKMDNREFFRQREAAVLYKIPGVRELITAKGSQRSALQKKYPDADFALKIISNPFIPDRELGAIQMDAYAAILNGEPISSVHYKYDRQMDAYVSRHNWD
ncbi:MAG: hypothetical protein IJ001_04745 [Oscillospiraceae bacterium]|nr:hypothetical protein [Oscillospiraceae bacterium]